jgi:Arc/MetJ-type ribon-helix-helix transcriptional regulator
MRHGRWGHGRGAAAAEGTERATTRVQLELPPQAMERLQRLKDKTEAASYAEVIRNALRVFEALANEHEQGAEFLVKRKDGSMTTYQVFV